jgi:hypothetical protein
MTDLVLMSRAAEYTAKEESARELARDMRA